MYEVTAVGIGLYTTGPSRGLGVITMAYRVSTLGTTIWGPHKLSVLQGILWGMHCSRSQEVTAPQNALRGYTEGLWVVSTMDENVCWWNVSMERELRGISRRGPIGWGNMTGAKGSEVGYKGRHISGKATAATFHWGVAPGDISIQGWYPPLPGLGDFLFRD